MAKIQYGAADNPYQAERARLDLLEGMNDPVTRRRMDTIGVGAGWCCLEVGAGGGSMVRWLSERVGGAGHVVACDVNPRFLQDLGLANVEVRTHNILEDELEADAFDLVHCRAVLMHLPEPETALRRMASAVRPGGWLMVEEGDYGMFGAADMAYPGAEAFDRITRTFFDVSNNSGAMQSALGRRLNGMLRGLGFVDMANEGLVRAGSGGDDPIGRFWSASFEVPGIQRIVEAGIVSADDIAHVKRMLQDPAFDFVGGVLFGAWGRKPTIALTS